MTLEEARALVERIDSHNFVDIRLLKPVDVCLDGYFTADQLEAIAMVMRASE